MTNKQCKSCGEIKPLVEYYKHKLNAGGYRPQCKACFNHLNGKVWESKRRQDRLTGIKIKVKLTSEEQKEKARARRRVSNRGPEYVVAQKEWRNKYYSDPQKNLARAIRRRLYMARKAQCKSGKTLEHLGCSWAELKLHLESQFQEGMTWDNYGQGGWHIDHIQPLCAFDLTSEEDLRIVCHYSNLRPLWQCDNLAKIVQDKQASLCRSPAW